MCREVEECTCGMEGVIRTFKFSAYEAKGGCSQIQKL